MTSVLLETDRLRLRSWQPDDAPAALPVYGDPGVARWLTPAMSSVADEAAMRSVLEQWVGEDSRLAPPSGRWAIESREDGRLLGGVVLLPLPPGDEDTEIGWQLHPDERGHGFATEAGTAVARWAFDEGLPELFAVARPQNAAAVAAARRMGMQWVGETEKYYDLRLQVYRLRPSDLSA